MSTTQTNPQTANEAMTIGTRLVELCKQGKNIDAINELYAEDATSVEAMACPEGDMERVMTGRDKIIAKNAGWFEANEVHSVTFDGPYPHGDRFIVPMSIDVTPKVGPMAGTRMQMTEMGLYTIENGKVVREEFFYHMG